MGESLLKSKPVRKHFTRVLRKTLIAQCRVREAKVKVRIEGGLMFVEGDDEVAITDALMHHCITMHTLIRCIDLLMHHHDHHDESMPHYDES